MLKSDLLGVILLTSGAEASKCLNQISGEPLCRLLEPKPETINNDTLVTSRAQDGSGSRKYRRFGNFEGASRVAKTINSDTLITSRAQDGKGTRK